MKKRILALLLTMAMIGGLLPLSGCGGKADQPGSNPTPDARPSDSQPDDQSGMTRGEWVTMLGQTFGLDQSDTETPYFSDVQPGDPLFSYVQAEQDWDVLAIFSGSSLLEPDRIITSDEMASTAAIAAGCTVEYNGDGSFDPAASLDYAAQHGIGGGSTWGDAEQALDAATETYLAVPASTENVVYTAEVQDLSAVPLQVSGGQITAAGTVSGGVATIDTGSGLVEVQAGGVLITAPTALDPAGVAYKVVSVEEVNGQVVMTTTVPELTDIFEELNIAATVEANLDNIVWEPGVSATVRSDGHGGHVVGLTARGGGHVAPMFTTSKNIPIHFSRGSFEKTWTNQNSDAITGEAAAALENSNFVYDKTPSIDDFNGSTESWTKNLQVENKFSAGYEITGNLNLNALTVTTTLELRLGLNPIKEASVQLDSKITSDLTFKGNVSNELKIATIPIPVAGPLSVNVELYLYLDASGSLHVSAELSSTAKVGYTYGSGVKRSGKQSASASAEAAIEVDFGAKLSAALSAVGIDIMDASVKVGAELVANASIGGEVALVEEDDVVKTQYSQFLTMKADLYAPIVTIAVGGDSLIGDLGLSKTWKITTRSNCGWHMELLNEEWTFWEETVLGDAIGGDAEPSDGAGEGNSQAPDWGQLDLAEYFCSVSVGGSHTISVSRLPEGRSAADVAWSTSDASVATVSGGVVTGVGEGVATITATLDGVSVQCTVSVSAS